MYKKLNQKGQIDPLVIPLSLSVVFLLVAAGTAIFFYTKYTEQRDANEPIIEAAVVKAETAQKEKLEAEFIEREKIPTKTYTSSAETGSVKFNYPKTWSSYVERKTAATMDYFGHPNYVPATGVNYALRMSVAAKAFATEIKSYDAQVKKGDLSATAVQISGVTGTRLDGFLQKDKEGSMVIFPLREKTLRVWTESKEYRSDFDNIVLKSLTFVP